MEQVFWLMYLADLSGSVAAVGIGAVMAAIVSMVFMTIMAVYDDVETGGYARAFRVLRWLLIPITIAVLLPSKQTIQLLAVVSASDAVASTQLGQKGVEAINAVLDRVIKESKKEAGK